MHSIIPAVSNVVYACRYEWVDVGMLDYDPDTKLYRVKRVYVPNHILERNSAREREREERENRERVEGQVKP